MKKSLSRLLSGGTELQANTRESLLLAQKAEVISDLTGAMANQFNNIMMAISSYAELELKKSSTAEKRSLEQVLSNAARATSLIQKLLAFTRRQVPSPQPLQLNRVVTELDNLLQLLGGENVEIALALDPKVHNIKVDRVELEQLILSLAIDGRNAMTSGGRLTVSTEIVDLDNRSIGDAGVQPGQYVVLSVADTGAAQNRPKDSLRPDPNSGRDLRISLALAAASGIAKEARGLVRVFSKPESGTSFKVYFPALEPSASEATARSAPLNHLPVARTILVVEDDDSVRIPATEFLKMEGFKVLQAQTGPEAIQVVMKNRSPLDLLITDIVMPGMSGPEVAENLIKMHPHLKVLYMSGDVDKAAPWNELAKSEHALLQKPFRLNVLNDRIHDLLGQ